MSVLDAFFNKGGFKGAKCKTLLKLTIPRIKLLRNRREIQLKQMRKDIAKLLENGQEATARIRVEHIIREENMMAAQEILELFCELIAVRLAIIETQRECPLDLKEAISSICFAAPRCADLPELQQVQMLFAAKYGREFVAAASELMPDCGVNRQIIELLSIRAPSVETKLKLLKEIAEEHEVEWDPSATETEFYKPHEDLLNGPNHIISSGSTLPLPSEKHDDSVSSDHTEEHQEEVDSDAGFDSLDFLEVPKVSVRATSDIPSAAETNPSTADFDNEIRKPEPPKTAENDTSTVVSENKSLQFVPFIAHPPPPPPFISSSLSEQIDPAPPSPQISLHPKKTDPTHFISHDPPPFVSSFSEHIDETPVFHRDPAPPSPPISLHSKKTNSTPFTQEPNIDLQDVLAAAQAAADSADRAAQAARAAASLAQVRISELITKKNNSREKNELPEDFNSKEISEKPQTFDQQNSLDARNYEPDHMHQPQRSVSIEDDPYFSYPNLFMRQDSGVKPGPHSSDA